MKFFTRFLLAVLAVCTISSNRAAAQSSLPPSLSDPAWRPLSQCWDRSLQAKLDQALNRRPLWRALIAAGDLAVGLVDLSHPRAPRFARVNGDTMMYAASLPKLAILLAAFQGFEDGALKETPEIRADLVEMIRRSDNAAASRLIARLGLRQIDALLLSPRYRFYDPKRGGGLWLGGYYTPGWETDPEPLKGLTHAATATQVCRFYYLVAYGRLLSPERSRQMLKVLAFPDLHDKFVSVLERQVPLQRLYRKSGQYKVWQSDSILVWGESWRRYILVALVEHRQGEQILRDLVPVVEGILWLH